MLEMSYASNTFLSRSKKFDHPFCLLLKNFLQQGYLFWFCKNEKFESMDLFIIFAEAASKIERDYDCSNLRLLTANSPLPTTSLAPLSLGRRSMFLNKKT
jgi:hypothetical protein